MNPYVLPSIMIFGWIVTHVFTLRAQGKNLRRQVLDRARDEITKELRLAQKWCGSAIAKVMSTEVEVHAQAMGHHVDWPAHARQVIDLM